MKKKMILIVILLLIIEIGIFSISKLYMAKVEKIENKSDGKMFALMVEQNKGAKDYQEIDDEEWPSTNYKFNKENSYCEDSDGNKIAKPSGYDLIDIEDGKAIVKTTKTVYCYLYFDVKTGIDFTFYLGGESNPKYTNNRNISLYINTSDSTADKYCINKTNNTSGCTWKNLSDLSFTLDSSNGTQTYYMFLKAKDGTITEDYQSDTIILDDVNPICGFDVNASGVTFTFSDNLELAGGGTNGTEFKGALSAKTYSGSISDAAGNNCSASKTVYNYYPSSTTYDLYSKSCYYNGVGGTNWAYEIIQRNVSVSQCNNNIEYYSQHGMPCTPNGTCWGSSGQGSPYCRVCVQSGTSARCDSGTQIPGTNYCA